MRTMRIRRIKRTYEVMGEIRSSSYGAYKVLKGGVFHKGRMELRRNPLNTQLDAHQN
jgi:hypothetical protein